MGRIFQRKILFRYIGTELLSPFCLGLFVFTFILLMNKIVQLMELVITRGVGLSGIAALVGYLLPSFLVLTLPMAVLLSVLITLGKLSSDSELIALKASGVSLYQMTPPFAVFCCCGCLLTAVLTLYLLPRGNDAFKRQALALARQHSEAAITEGVFCEAIDDMVLYINHFDRRHQRVRGVLVSDQREQDAQRIIIAREGTIESRGAGQALVFHLTEGSLHWYDRTAGSYQYAVFDTYEMNIPLQTAELEDRERKSRELGLRELLKTARARQAAGQSPVRQMVELHQRLAFPLACLVFGLLGVPLGVSWRRGGRSYGFVVSIVVVFLYYMLLNVGENLAKSGYIHAGVGMWMPNVLFGGLGIYLFRTVSRERQTPFSRVLQRIELVLERLAARLRWRTPGSGRETRC